MRRVRRSLVLFPVGATLLAAAGCGGGGEEQSQAGTPRLTARAAAFPAARGRTLDTLRDRLPAGPILAPSTATLEVGRNRFGFALFTPDRKQLTTARVALYTSDHDGSNVRGPYVARLEASPEPPGAGVEQTAVRVWSAKRPLLRFRGATASPCVREW